MDLRYIRNQIQWIIEQIQCIKNGDCICDNIIIPENTSDLINDGEDGINPFITNEDVVIDSSLNPTLAMPSNIFGFPAGTTIADINGLTLTQYIEIKDFPTILASITNASNLIVSGFNSSLVEVGVQYAPSLSVSFDIGNINNGDGTVAGPVAGDLLTVNISTPSNPNSFVDNSITGNSTSGVASHIMIQGTNSWITSGTNAVGTTIYTDNKGGTDTIPSIEAAKLDTIPNNITLNKSAVIPFHYGMTAVDLTAGGTGLYNGGLTKLIQSSGNKSVLLNGTAEFIYFVYPTSYGPIASIIDGNGFNVTSSFSEIIANITSTGLATNYTESCRILRTNSLTSVPNQIFQFNF